MPAKERRRRNEEENPAHEAGRPAKKTIIEQKDDGGRAVKQIEYWTVKKVYPYVVLAERGGNRECFDVGWLVQNGYEYQYKVPTGKLHGGHHKR